jgi:preprotein translocase subunit SecD
MMSSLDELGDMIRKQQQLRDRTFKKGQQSQRAPQSMDDLKQDQQALRERLSKLLEQLRQRGLGQPGRTGQQRAQHNTDPLGRPLRARDYGDDVTVKVPGEIDAQRARRILEELRRRFADPARPQLELDYIERLLKDF